MLYINSYLSSKRDRCFCACGQNFFSFIESNRKEFHSINLLLLWRHLCYSHKKKIKSYAIHMTETTERRMKYAMSVCRLIVQDNLQNRKRKTATLPQEMN